MNSNLVSIIAAVSALSLGGAAMAQTAAGSVPGPPPATAKVKNPNEKICQKLEVIGSRLSTRRVCMTRAQWADAQLQDRLEVERVQTQRGAKAE